MVDVLLQWRSLNAFRIIADYILHPGLAALQFDFSQVRSGAAHGESAIGHAADGQCYAFMPLTQCRLQSCQESLLIRRD